MPILKRHFPDTQIDAARLHAASNRVEAGLVRVYADEVTYNLHIIIRFELEVALLEGSLDVADLPAAWNESYANYLGVHPADDAEGVLQDVHWSQGAFGYFPELHYRQSIRSVVGDGSGARAAFDVAASRAR